MFYIAICDDNEQMCRELAGYIAQFAESASYDIQTDVFLSGKNLLAGVGRQPYDIIFLDIMLGEESGIDIGQKLREPNTGYDHFLVYMSSQDFPASQIIHTNALDYLLKPFAYKTVADVLSKAVRGISAACETVTVKSQGDSVKIKLKDMLYIETQGRQSIIVTPNLRVPISEKLNDLEQLIHSPYFIRVHHSILVNYDHILKYSNRTLSVIVDNGDQLTISQPRRKEAYEAYLKLSEESL